MLHPPSPGVPDRLIDSGQGASATLMGAPAQAGQQRHGGRVNCVASGSPRSSATGVARSASSATSSASSMSQRARWRRRSKLASQATGYGISVLITSASRHRQGASGAGDPQRFGGPSNTSSSRAVARAISSSETLRLQEGAFTGAYPGPDRPLRSGRRRRHLPR